jgi:hypothetical protein
MNEHPNNQMRDDEPLPADLLAISGSLDQLGEIDRAAAGASFEQRLAASTFPGLPVGVEQMDSLVSADRDAASATLEDRIFVATRALLNRPVETVASDADAATFAPAPIRIHTRSFRWALRAAAVLTLGAGATLVYLSNQPSPNPTIIAPKTSPSDTDIAKQLEADFQNLGNFLTVALGGSESETAESSSTDSGDLEFPSLDFLNSEVEGSI